MGILEPDARYDRCAHERQVTRAMNPFTAHPASVGETYGEHGRVIVEAQRRLGFRDRDGPLTLHLGENVVERALRDQKLTIDESRVLLKFYENGLEGYTYLE